MPLRIALLLLIAALMLTVAAFRPIDHDEGQYVGAVAMMRFEIFLCSWRDLAQARANS